MQPTEKLSDLSVSAMLILQMAYASGARRIISDPSAFVSVGLAYDAEDAAFVELQGLALLHPSKTDGEIRPTERGWALIDQIWPHGQLPDNDEKRLVIGSFDGQEEMPVRFAVPVPDIADIVPSGSRFADEISVQGLRCDAWELLLPSMDGAEDRFLARVVDGKGLVSEHPSEIPGYGGNAVGPGTWLSLDRSGQCREIRISLEQIVFLIAVGAA